jgi:two-component system NarL family sensor kinase
MPKPTAADNLARECVRAHRELRRAAGVLHDDVGSLLAVAGLRLQLLCMDLPEAGARAAEAAEALEGAMEHIRKLSRELEPSPVRRTGLKNAIFNLTEKLGGITVRFSCTAELSPAAADAVYHAIASALAAASAAPRVTRIAISISGSRSVKARIAHNGRHSNAELAAAALLARHAGLGFKVERQRQKTEQGTIVTIQYAGRRSAGR